MKSPITSAQAMQHPIVVETINALSQMADDLRAERDTLRTQLEAMQRQEPVALEKIEAAWRAGWAACRDAEYVGQEAENEAWGMSQTCASADWENASPKAQEPLTDERIDELEDAAFRDYMEGRIDCYTYAVARAIEAAHGILGESK